MKDYTTQEVADRIGKTRQRVIQLIWDGTLVAVKHGRDYIIKEEDLKKFEAKIASD